MTEPDILELAEVYADLGGVSEVAAALGVPKRRVDRWIERRESTGCPSPVRPLTMGHVYSIADWRGWHALWRITRGAQQYAADDAG